MADTNNLYFVRILQAAFLERDRTRALKSAFDEIARLGNASEYREGYRNFLNLIKSVENEVISDVALEDEVIAETLEARILDIVTNSIEGSDDDKQVVVRLIQEHPEFRLILQEMQSSLAILHPIDSAVEIEVEKDGFSFGLYRLEPGFDHIVIPGVQEGEYEIKLSSGLLLWRDRIEGKDVLWQVAYPGQKLPVAAETMIMGQLPTRSIDLLHGEVRLELFPSLESGAIVLSFKRANAS